MATQEEIGKREEPPQRHPIDQDAALEQDVRAVLSDDPAAIAQEVRRLTLRALTEGTLEPGAVQRVVRAVVAGATQGAPEARDGRAALVAALQGLDQALAAGAQAIRLTLEEAIANAGAFSQETLSRGLEDLATLESLFIETVSQTASGTAGFIGSALLEVVDHARASGSAVGSAVQEGLSTLRQAIPEALDDQVHLTSVMLRKETELLASLSCGVLQGIADRWRGSQGPVAPEEP